MPETDEEWQDAVSWAELLLTLDSLQQEGLITGVPEIDRTRCEEILREGAARGFEPAAQNDLITEYFGRG